MKPQKRLLSALLALALVWGLIPALPAQAQSMGLVYSQTPSGSVELSLEPVPDSPVIHGVQLELTLPGGGLEPDKVLLSPADNEAFSPAFSTLVSQTDTTTTVALYLVSAYALNTQSSLPLGTLSYQGKGIVPKSARAALLSQDTILNGGTVDMTDIPVGPGQTSLPFTDVTGDSWYYDAVSYAYTNQLMSGVGNGRFDPDGSTKRGMIVTILYQMEGKPAVSGDIHFSDVPQGKWYSSAVNWASQNRIVAGYDDGTFRPDNSITRGAFAGILDRFLRFQTVSPAEPSSRAMTPAPGVIWSSSRTGGTWPCTRKRV